MRAQRGVAASFRVSLLLLGTALAWSAPGHARDTGHGGKASQGRAASDLGIAPPDLPEAGVTINAADLNPGDDARQAMSRIVADPGSVLKAYAPLGRDKADPNTFPTSSIPLTRSLAPASPRQVPGTVLRASLGAPPASPPQPAAERPSASPLPPVLPYRPADAGDRSAAARASQVADAPPAPGMAAPAAEPKVAAAEPTPAAGPVLPAPAQAQAAPAQAAPSPRPDTPAPASVAGAPAEPPAPSAKAVPAVLDAAALQAALTTFVGAEPAHAPGQAAAQAEARFRDRQAVAAVYAARNYAPFWIENGRFNAKARSVLSRIDHAAEDGLDLAKVPVTVPHDGDAAAALAASELGLTDAAVTYGRQASGGRVDPSRLGPLFAPKADVADPARVLNSLSAAEDAGEALHAFNPPQKGYALLRDKLAELRRNTDVAGHNPIPYGPTLRPGMRDARVPLIRTRFGLGMPTEDADQAGLVYDTQVAAAVAQFQRAHHLPASGVLTIRTIAAMSGGDPRRLENEIIANMEFWRWLPRDMGQDHLEVNIPDYSLNVMHGDAVFHHARVVVGQPDKPTPVFSETMQFIIVNPYWNVPLSIVKKEMMPKLAADPDYFTNHGYEVVERAGITYVRQPPGDSNALGRIKFMFPNKYSVYLHDTNARALFGTERRALSHGCVRVEQPFKLAEAVLGRENGWSEARVKRMIGGSERTISLPHPLPLHIVYFTAFVDDTGALRLRDDVYGYTAKLKTALGLQG